MTTLGIHRSARESDGDGSHRFSPTIGTWVGLVVCAAGFAMIIYAWIRVAAVVNVAEQVPYVVSGGLTGLALVIVGMATVDVAARRQDSNERLEQMAEVSRLLTELRPGRGSDDEAEV